MADTFGSLIDKLSVTNIKVWMAMDKLYEASNKGTDLDAKYVNQVASLNLMRNQLMTEIDQALNQAIKDGSAAVDPRIKITS